MMLILLGIGFWGLLSRILWGAHWIGWAGCLGAGAPMLGGGLRHALLEVRDEFENEAHVSFLPFSQEAQRSHDRGYFEYEAEVDGDARLSLDVPLDQVDDILKSLVVYDERGTAGEITLPGREPLTQRFVDLPFDHSALDSAPALLNSLQGAEVRVAGAKPMSGRLVARRRRNLAWGRWPYDLAQPSDPGDRRRDRAIRLGGCRQHRLRRSRAAEKGRHGSVAAQLSQLGRPPATHP